MKLALNQRPAYHLLSKRLNDIINRTWQSLFIVDIQNDCDCGIERYKVDSDQRVAYVSSNGCKFSYLSGDIDLPMQRNFSEYNLEVLLKYSFDKSKKRLNMPPDKILYNKNTALNKLNIIKNKQQVQLNSALLYN